MLSFCFRREKELEEMRVIQQKEQLEKNFQVNRLLYFIQNINRKDVVLLIHSLLSNLSDNCIFWKFEFLFHEDSQYTGVWKYCAVCLKIDYTQRHLFSILTVKTSGALCACALRPLNREDTDKCTLTITYTIM